MEYFDETNDGEILEYDDEFFKLSLIPADEQKETLDMMRIFLRENRITNARIHRILFRTAHYLPKKRVRITLERCLLYNGKTPAYFRKALQREREVFLEDIRDYLRNLKIVWKMLEALKTGAKDSNSDAAKNKLLAGFFTRSGADLSAFSLKDENAQKILKKVADNLLEQWKFTGKYAEHYGWDSLLPPENVLKQQE